MKQTLSRISLVGAVMLLLAACGPAGGQTQAPATDTAVAETATSETSSGVVPVSSVQTAETRTTTDTAVAADDQIVTRNTYIDLYQRLNDSVVNIQVVSTLDATQLQLPEGFQLPEGMDPNANPIPQTGEGSGFVYDTEGHIVTNNHVVANADSITVIFPNGTEVDATVVGTDPGSDLAVIQVETDNLPAPIPLGSSDDLRVGELVAAIGNPFGLDGSTSTGIISGLGRLLPGGATSPSGQSFNIPDIIQTDTAINPGNSGGPLLNLDGEVVGVNTAIQTTGVSIGQQASFGGIGYAVPADIVKQVVPQLIDKGEIIYPWLGIAGGTLTNSVAEEMGLDPNQNGVLVSEVVEDGPAAKAGLQGITSDTEINGDVITQIDDQPIEAFDDLLEYIVRKTTVGQTVDLTIIRDGETQQVQVTLEARP